jgi:hypothetical protein
MIVAAHQPAYLPWLGYLDKMAKADVFVVMDDLQFEAQNFQNRQRVKLDSGAGWLTVPVVHGAQTDRILDKRIDNAGSLRQHWQRRTWRTFEIHYARAPHFARYADELRDIYTRPWDRLLDLDLELLSFARRVLRIHVPIVLSSSLGLVGTKTDRLIDLCKKLGARAYLSGSGGSAGYLDTERMGRAGIGVIWQHFDHPTYPQRYEEAHGFIARLGFVDLLFNCGEASSEILLPRTHPVHAIAHRRAG